jgi:hypothetical protein
VRQHRPEPPCMLVGDGHDHLAKTACVHRERLSIAARA